VLSTHVGRRRKFGKVSCTECTFKGSDFELIPSIEVKTGHPVECYFGRELPAITAKLWRSEIAKRYISLRFLEKRPIAVKFPKISSKSFHRDNDRRIV